MFRSRYPDAYGSSTVIVGGLTYREPGEHDTAPHPCEVIGGDVTGGDVMGGDVIGGVVIGVRHA